MGITDTKDALYCDNDTVPPPGDALPCYNALVCVIVDLHDNKTK